VWAGPDVKGDPTPRRQPFLWTRICLMKCKIPHKGNRKKIGPKVKHLNCTLRKLYRQKGYLEIEI